MRVGLTYDLRSDYLAAGYGEEETAEFDAIETIVAIEEALRELGFDPCRIGNIRMLTEQLAAGERWDFVFNIAEGLHGPGRESQVPALLDAFAIPYTFSDPLVMAVTLHKPTAKLVVQAAGIRTAAFTEVKQQSNDSIREQVSEFPLPAFVKPSSEGTGKGVTAASVVRDRAALIAACEAVHAKYKQSALVETFLPGREFTVGILGSGDSSRALGVLEIVLLPGADAEVYSYDNKELCDDRVRCTLATDNAAKEAEAVALAAWRALDCLDGGRVDVRFGEDGQAYFIEVNPLAGLRPGHSDLVLLADALGYPYRSLIGTIAENCLRRYGLTMPSPRTGDAWAA